MSEELHINGLLLISVIEFASINGHKSNLADVRFGISQGFMFSFPFYINDLHLAIKNSEAKHTIFQMMLTI